MRRICAWCKAPLPAQPADDPTILEVSHGICTDCAAQLEDDARKAGIRINATVMVYDDPRDPGDPITSDDKKKIEKWIDRFRSRTTGGER